MSTTYTFDVFSSLDGYGSHQGDWGGYWGKQGPEFLANRLTTYEAEHRMVLGATTYRDFVEMLGASSEEPEVLDPWITRMRSMPATVVSSTLEEPLERLGDATVAGGDAVDVIARRDRPAADLRGRRRLRPRVDREPDLRRPHAGADLPTHPSLTGWDRRCSSRFRRGRSR